jgi:hypothetical protein
MSLMNQREQRRILGEQPPNIPSPNPNLLTLFEIETQVSRSLARI